MTPGAGGGQLKYLTSTPYTQHAVDQFQPPIGLATPSPYQVVKCVNAWRLEALSKSRLPY